MQNIAQGTIWNLLLAFPDTAEQNLIAAFLDRETAKLDTLIRGVSPLGADGQTGKLGLLIDKLHEYRTALISAAVTGKIDVRAYNS